MSQSKLLAEYESMLQLTTGQTLSPLETSEQVLGKWPRQMMAPSLVLLICFPQF